MAYINQTKKQQLAPSIKKICKEYGVKASIAISNNSSLILNIKQGKVNFFKDYNVLSKEESCKFGIEVNPYHYQNQFKGKSKEFLKEILTAMNDGNYDLSDIQTDYFNVGWYVSVNIGKWKKPYLLV
tara:strand:- start:2478 stop:2858 length:381 start_codon:yes stop_codon:yes gene_type:complete